uniref:Variant surface glycoprotein 1125.39 n=1 Tax=Trypanosoma brucei TaxID=5691 RepID=A0A1J0R541_9TRYP|nr:variant surface glycoprotein 1125.39 [Trypanosoma brucei]
MPKQLFYVTVVAILCDQTTAGPKGGNVEVMAKLCDALRLGDNPITFEPQEETSFKGEPAVLKLNMSLAPKEWRDKFVTRTGPDKVDPIAVAPPGTPEDWKNMWQRWAAIAAELNKPHEEEKVLKAYNLESITTEQKEMVRHQIAIYADAALAAITTSENKTTDADDEALKAAINGAIYGRGKDASKELDHKALTGEPSVGYGTSCGNDAAVKESKTLAHAIACVCGTANTLANEEPCITEGNGDVQWERDDIPKQQKWQKIRAACPKVPPRPLTATRIRTALATAATAIVTINNDAYIGHKKTDCDGNSNTACLKLTDAARGNNEPLTKVLWLQQLATVAAKLEQRQKYNVALVKQKNEIQTIERQVKALTKRAIFLKHVEPAAIPVTASSDNKKIAEETQTLCSAHNNNNATCPRDTCTYDQNENKCKPKSGTTETKEAEETPNAESKKCSEKKTEGECKNGCKWEGETCKDSSFLVNRKFALSVVSAAFVALLF